MSDAGRRGLIHGSTPSFDPQRFNDLLAAASDLAFVVSAEGLVESVLAGGDCDGRDRLRRWVGRPMRDFLTSESVPKYDEAVRTLGEKGHVPRRVELNHADGGDWQYPVRYSFHAGEREATVLMIGRDLRAVAETQEQLVLAQIALEEGFERRRAFDARYRLLMANTREALVFLSPDGRVRDANAAAAALLGTTVESLAGAPLAKHFEGPGSGDFAERVNTVANSELESEIAVKTLRTRETVRVVPKIFRTAGERLAFCRMLPAAAARPEPDRLARNLRELFLKSTDAIVICTPKGVIKDVNEAFLDLTGLSRLQELRSRSLADFLQRGQVDLKVLLDNTLRLGRMPVYCTRMSGEFGSRRSVEISSVHLDEQDKPAVGLVFRDAARVEAMRGARQAASQGDAPNQNVIDLVGSATLKEIVAETNDVVERMCIGAAVELTGNNRAAAAQMLGLSRQSLYVKLRKCGLLERDG